MKTHLFHSVPIALMLTIVLAGCGTAEDQGPIGTLVFTANGEDFVRDGFVSEDGWAIEFEQVYVNVFGPTAYQVVEEPQLVPGLRHGGHPHEDIPNGAAHVSLTGDMFLSLKQATFELGQDADAPIGNYNRLAFTVRPAPADAQDLEQEHLGSSIVLLGTASLADETIAFRMRFEEEMAYSACGPNGEAGVLAEGGQAEAQLTFHFDHIFGDFEEGPAEPEDPETINYIAIGFGPFAELAEDGQLDVDQQALSERMSGATYLQLIEAVRTLGHSGEGHCHLD